MRIKNFLTIFAASFIAVSYSQEVMHRKTGAIGKVAIVNTCNASSQALENAARQVDDLLMINIVVTSGKWTLRNAEKNFSETGANAAVFIINEPCYPISLVAMEGRWGVVNTDGLDDKCLIKEVLRVLTLVLGGASSHYQASSMRPAFSKDDLATRAGSLITFDSIMNISTYMPALGIRPYELISCDQTDDERVAPKIQAPSAVK